MTGRRRVRARAIALRPAGPGPAGTGWGGGPGPLVPWSVWRAGRSHERDLSDGVPLAADLMAMALGAGLSLFLALQVAAQSAPPAVATRLVNLLDGVDRGARLGDALEEAAVSSRPLRPLLSALLTSERTGAPVAAALARLAADLRERERQSALGRARTVPVRLLFPLVFLVLPAFVLLTVAPVLLAGLSGGPPAWEV